MKNYNYRFAWRVTDKYRNMKGYQITLYSKLFKKYIITNRTSLGYYDCQSDDPGEYLIFSLSELQLIQDTLNDYEISVNGKKLTSIEAKEYLFFIELQINHVV